MTFEEAKELLVAGHPIHRKGWLVDTARLYVGQPSKTKLQRWCFSRDDEPTNKVGIPDAPVQPVDLGCIVLCAVSDDEVLADDSPVWSPRQKDLAADDWSRFE